MDACENSQEDSTAIGDLVGEYLHCEWAYRTIRVSVLAPSQTHLRVEWIQVARTHPRYNSHAIAAVRNANCADIRQWIANGYWVRKWPSCCDLPEGV